MQNTVSSQEQYVEQYVNGIAYSSTPVAMTLEEVKKATQNDPILQIVFILICSGSWFEIKS